MASPENPFSTCLFGLPLGSWPHPPLAHVLHFVNHADVWDQWVPYFPHAALEPQELEFLGCVKMDLCVKFNYSGAKQSKARDVSPSQHIVKNESSWCNYTSTNTSHSTNAQLLLPAGVVLLVERELGLPFHHILRGGPCSLG